MRTHITTLLMAMTLILAAACASKREVASVQDSRFEQDRADHAIMMDSHASRIR